MADFDIRSMFTDARALTREQYVEKERLKLGNLRAGSSGMMSENGEVAGGCVRKAHLRQLGIEVDPPTTDKLIMFDLGFASEDIVYQRLLATLPETHMILREEEIPISWLTSNGTPVTGRPDIVICAKPATSMLIPNGSGINVNMLNMAPGKIVYLGEPPQVAVLEGPKPELLLELKSVHSLWTARDVLFNRHPKLANMIQAGHYMWKLGTPGKLIYSAYSQLGQGMAGTDSWASKLFPRMGQPMSQYVEYNESKGTIKHIRQFDQVYDLQFDQKGRLSFRVEGEADSKFTRTLITQKSIEQYYEFVSKMTEEKKLGPRPSQIDALGDKASWKDCTYCALQNVCDSHEKKGYDKWLHAVMASDDVEKIVK